MHADAREHSRQLSARQVLRKREAASGVYKSGNPTADAPLGEPVRCGGSPRCSTWRETPRPHCLNGQMPQVGKPAHGTVLPNALPRLSAVQIPNLKSKIQNPKCLLHQIPLLEGVLT
ncbi:hypothetical protein [Brasilonema bromeliae]|uniref:hypothetical protein n=1 Tax=Brasilonema bromeliae TaxID=383615 RepID=UPI00145E577E